MRNTTSKVLTFAVLVFGLFFSCRKYDVSHSSQQKLTSQNDFFRIPDKVDPEIVKVIKDLQSQPKLTENLPAFISKNGIPRWDKVHYKVSNNGDVNAAGEQGIFLIPLQSAKSPDIKSYIVGYKHKDGLYTYRLYNKDSLERLGNQPDRLKTQLMNTMAVFGFFEKTINGKDSILVNSPHKGYIKNANIEFAKVPNINGRSSSATATCYFQLEIVESYLYVEVYVNGVLAATYEEYSFSMTLDIYCDGGGGGGGDGGSGGYWGDYGTGWPYNGGGVYDPWYPWWTSGGGGTPPGAGFPYDFSPFNLYNGFGGRPLAEYADTAKCQGVQDIWNNYPNNEVMAYLTADGKLIVTDVLPLNGGSARGLYTYNDPVTNTTKYYYTYPVSQGAPSQSYAGMVNNGQYYFIPVVASVHTHSPCRTDGTNGVSQPVGLEDQSLAQSHPGLRNWVIGCGAIAQFNDSNPDFFNVQSGQLANLCGSIN